MSQVELGHNYLDGEGVQKSRESAVYWFQKAADERDAQGDLGAKDIAEFMMGVMLYQEGNFPRAIEYLMKAAKKGNKGAQEFLRDPMHIDVDFDSTRQNKENSTDPAELESEMQNIKEIFVCLDPKTLSENGYTMTSCFKNQLEEQEEDRSMEPVTFIRPGGDTETKDVGWCESNGFWEIDDGVWSGPWGRGDDGNGQILADKYKKSKGGTSQSKERESQ